MPDEVPKHAPASFSAIPALIVRQRPRGASRERRKRGQSGHEEDKRFNTSGPGPRMVHERSPATLHLPGRPPNRFKMAFRPRFGMFLPHQRPEIPLFSGSFVCMYPIEPTDDCPGTTRARVIDRPSKKISKRCRSASGLHCRSMGSTAAPGCGFTVRHPLRIIRS